MSDDAPRLYLATPPLAQASDIAAALTQAVKAGDIASLLIRFAGAETRANEDIVRALAPIAQEKGVAVLAEGEPNIALRAGADGGHVDGAGEALSEAIAKLSPRYIVGAGGFATRDDAMRAGEMGADYVLLGAEDAAALRERVAWWAELFVTPCVARAATLAEVAPLAQAGADFILLDDAVWSDPRGPAAAVADAQTQLKGALA